MTTLYGISNCDTVKKARAWFAGRGATVKFHDFKREGVPAESLAAWIAALGHEALLNRKGTTWRELSAAEQAGVIDAASAARLLIAHPSLIKRPVVEWPGGTVTVGFDASRYADLTRP